MQTIHRTIVIACFAMWFGGFGFYVSIVVPIGTDVLGSARHQGMITQLVTQWINIFSAIAFVAMTLELLLNWKRLSRNLRYSQLGLVLFMIAALVGLVALHPLLDAMINREDQTISDEGKFYQLHRAYLWLSTVQWIAAWLWLIVLLSGWRHRGNHGIKSTG